MAPVSKWWSFFTKIDDKSSLCKVCNKTVKTSGNTTNLKIHYSRQHTSIARKDDAEASTSSKVDGKLSKHPTIMATIPKMIHAIKGYEEGGSRDAELTNLIVDMIIQDGLTFNITEKTGFKALMKKTSPLYKLPSKKTIKRRIDDKYDVVKIEVQKLLKRAESISITCDGWTETMNTVSYLGVTAHFLIDWQLYSVDLCVNELDDRHTGDYIGKKLLEVLDDWEIEQGKIFLVVTDNASNIKKAIVDTFGKERHIGCLAHTLNLVATSTLEGFTTLLSAVKAIVTWFKQSVISADALRKAQGQGTVLKLKQSVPTRWNSTFYMLERFVLLSQYISPILLGCPNSPRMLSANEMAVVGEMLLLLKPLEAATRDICGSDYVTTSRVIPLINCLTVAVKNVFPKTKAVADMKAKLLQEIRNRLSTYNENIIMGIATIADPRFKSLHIENPVFKAKCIAKLGDQCSSAIENTASEESENDQDDSIWKTHTMLKKKNKEKSNPSAGSGGFKELPSDLRHYLAQETIDIKSDPLQYWVQHNSSSISPVAARYLGTVATSVPSERLFSKANLTMTELRNRLKPDTLNKILFLKSAGQTNCV